MSFHGIIMQHNKPGFGNKKCYMSRLWIPCADPKDLGGPRGTSGLVPGADPVEGQGIFEARKICCPVDV